MKEFLVGLAIQMMIIGTGIAWLMTDPPLEHVRLAMGLILAFLAGAVMMSLVWRLNKPIA